MRVHMHADTQTNQLSHTETQILSFFVAAVNLPNYHGKSTQISFLIFWVYAIYSVQINLVKLTFGSTSLKKNENTFKYAAHLFCWLNVQAVNFHQHLVYGENLQGGQTQNLNFNIIS